MKKFFIFIFAMFGLMVGFVAIVLSGYYRDYEKFHNRSSFPEPKENLLVPVSTRAYAKAKSWSEKSPLSKQQIKNYLTKYGRYSEYTSQSAVNKLNIDWKDQAVLRAKSYQKFHYSKEKLVGQLVDVDLFTPEEADYAIEKVHFDWKEEAVKEAESSANGGNISKERLLEILVENRKFTQEEAEYAIEHAQVDWLN
ncbi:Ltp family lipoprotein [Streptococcus parasanguinis]|uniref:Ltp family lipoprotein n=1 Tax=Streptococcus parasanguinis TaxID=1318 RepID=UPI00066A58BB|nr:Ltp family lipoprotein [Streptococcus parasanguinis]